MPSVSSSPATAPMSASVLRSAAEQHFQHAHIRDRAAENLHVLDCPAMIASRRLRSWKSEHLAELADAYPGKSFGHALDFRVSLFADSRDGDFRAGLARSLKHEKRELPVACD